MQSDEVGRQPEIPQLDGQHDSSLDDDDDEVVDPKEEQQDPSDNDKGGLNFDDEESAFGSALRTVTIQINRSPEYEYGKIPILVTARALQRISLSITFILNSNS